MQQPAQPIEPIESPLGQEHQYNDTFNAKALVEQYGDQIRYVKSWGWLAWDGKRWERDADHQVIEFAKTTIQKMFWDAGRMNDRNAQWDLIKHARRSLDYNRLCAMINAAKSDPHIRGKVTDFDTDPYLFNVSNGTIDLRGEMPLLRPHDPANMITRVSPVAYDPEARSDVWDRFIDWVSCGDPDLQGYLQRAFGYTLTGLTGEKCFFVGYGPGGDNGKSTLLNAIRNVMGSDYALAVAPATVTTMNGVSGDQTRENVALVGMRMVMTVEPDSKSYLNSGRLKALTGSDILPVRPLYKEAYDYQPELKLWMATNARLAVTETGNAMFGRIREIPFDAHIERDKMDTDLPHKLQEAAPAILAWMVEGTRKWQVDRLKEPACMTEALKDYRAEQDAFQVFLDECCEVDPDPSATLPLKDILARYSDWQRDELDAPSLSQKTIRATLESHGVKARRRTGGHVVFGRRLRPLEPKQDRQRAYQDSAEDYQDDDNPF